MRAATLKLPPVSGTIHHLPVYQPACLKRIMFQKITKKIVEEMDPEGLALIPMKSAYFSDHYKPLRLLIKMKKSFFSTREGYAPTSIRLTDILKDGQDLDFGLTNSSFANYSEDFSGTVKGKADVNVSNIESGIRVSGSTSNSLSVMEMRKQIIDVNKLLDVIGSRKVNREHSFMKQLMMDVVYVVSEVIETEKPCTVDWTFQAESKLSILLKILKVKSGFGMNLEKKLTFSAGTTIAYKVSELRISSEDIMELNWILSIRETMTVFTDQKGRIASSVDGLTKLSAEQRLPLLSMVLETLGSSENLPVLDAMLEQMHEGLQPDLQVLDLMEERSRASVEKMLDLLGIKKADPPGQPLTLTQDQNSIIQAVNFLIQSLSEIDPETLILLAHCVEAKIISKQRDLVKIIDEKWCLEQRCLLAEGAEDPEKTLIAQLTDEEMEITQRILDGYGFQMDRESSSVSRIDGRRQQSVLPLFAALSALCILSA
ncbi:gasdermin-A3-like [Hemitrygon akajei]|uniref:gasdermin-A3-like n=1 Tax=Hemitrygon akajei TaxID=2704970 RepID=UPI003BFA2A99